MKIWFEEDTLFYDIEFNGVRPQFIGMESDIVNAELVGSNVNVKCVTGDFVIRNIDNPHITTVSPLYNNRIEEIKERWNKATPGSWERINPGSVIGHIDRAAVRGQGEFDWICSMQVSNCPNWENDAEAISKAPEDIQYLLSKLEIAEKVIKSALDDTALINVHAGSDMDKISKVKALDTLSGALKQLRE